jgi:hypothetical protein
MEHGWRSRVHLPHDVPLMYYKAFVLLRLPMSVLCLCGFGLLNMWQELGMGFFGFVVVVGLLVFLAITTRRLARRRRGAFRLAWRLLLLEFAGAVLFVGSHDMAAGWNMGYVFAWACTVLVVWTAPNAFLLYRWRWKFLNAGKKSRAANPALVSAAAMYRTPGDRRAGSKPTHCNDRPRG